MKSISTLPSTLISSFILAVISLPLFTLPVSAQTPNTSDVLPQVQSGKVERLALFKSRFIEARNIDIWLPEGYDANNKTKRYNVIYMHDGQMLYDEKTTWNKQAWHADQTVAQLMAQGKIADTLIVGVWNNAPLRHSEYFPQKAIALITEPTRSKLMQKGLHDKALADNYLRFLVEELKPAIDQKYRTLPEREHTFLMGSSMGGLISIYAMSEYPDVFGGAACLSTHWVGGFEANAAMPLAFFTYLQAHLPDPKTHKIYMDRGTATLDALYAMPQPVVDQIVKDRGYNDVNFMTRVFEGAAHTEVDWAKRLAIPVTFLLSK